MKRRRLIETAAGAAALTVASAAAWPVRGATRDVPAGTAHGGETTLTTADIATFQSRLRGQAIAPGDAPYEETRKVWNGMIDRHPALIARCAGADDVIAAVTFARAHDLLVAVRAGGHSYSGQSTVEKGMMIDLQGLKQITVDAKARTAKIGGGVLLGEMDRATQQYGLATPAGVVHHTGVAGLTLGGGVGRLQRKFGLTIDNVLSVDLVTADGRFLRASPTENPELFWGVRGGGGNFGIVTTFEFQLHPVGSVQSYAYAYPLEQADQVLRAFFDYTPTAPDELFAIGGISSGASGKVAVSISGSYLGTPEEAAPVLDKIAKFGKPLSARVAPVSYVDVQYGGPNVSPAGMSYYSKGGFTAGDLRQIEPLIASFTSAPPPQMHVIFLALGGAAGRIDKDATAFAHRDAHYQIDIGGSWDGRNQANAKTGEDIVAWSRKAWDALLPYTTGGFYANQSMEDGERAIRENYRDHYPRLLALKRQYDPTNFFRLNANINPKA